MAQRTGTCIVVGSSSGIGLAVARRLAAAGRKVAMLARRESELAAQVATTNDVVGRQLAFAFVHDAADLDAVEPLFARIEQDLGPVDEVHFVAAVMPDVAIDEFDLAKDEPQVRVNMLGCIAWGNAAARRFLPRKSGCFVGVSSVAGDRGRVGRPVYNASKAGMDTYLEALRNRLARHGVHVLTVKPGFVKTEMLKAAQGSTPFAIPPEQAAADIWKAIRKRKQVIYTPARWRWIMLAIQHTPSFIFRKLSF